MENKNKKEELRKVIERNNSRRIMREYPTYPPQEVKRLPFETIVDTISGIWDFFNNGDIDFKKDKNGIHLKIDKEKNK